MTAKRKIKINENLSVEAISYDVPVQPLFENVVTVREEEEKYVGALHIPETAKEKPMGAKVVAVGPDVKVVKVGDFALVGRYAGAEVVFRDVKYTILREAEILGIVVGEAADRYPE